MEIYFHIKSMQVENLNFMQHFFYFNLNNSNELEALLNVVHPENFT